MRHGFCLFYYTLAHGHGQTEAGSTASDVDRGDGSVDERGTTTIKQTLAAAAGQLDAVAAGIVDAVAVIEQVVADKGYRSRTTVTI